VTEDERGDGHVADEGRGEPSASHRVARRVKAGAGSVAAAAVVVCVAAGWVLLGAVTDFPRWWELLATVGVPFLTLLMVVVLQQTQNHDDRATQLKLDELIRATHTATNRMMTVEEASRADLDRIHEDFHSQAQSAGDGTSDAPRPATGSSGATDPSPAPG
jgi:low affinity Fe/Cu permease